MSYMLMFLQRLGKVTIIIMADWHLSFFFLLSTCPLCTVISISYCVFLFCFVLVLVFLGLLLLLLFSLPCACCIVISITWNALLAPSCFGLFFVPHIRLAKFALLFLVDSIHFEVQISWSWKKISNSNQTWYGKVNPWIIKKDWICK